MISTMQLRKLAPHSEADQWPSQASAAKLCLNAVSSRDISDIGVSIWLEGWRQLLGLGGEIDCFLLKASILLLLVLQYPIYDYYSRVSYSEVTPAENCHISLCFQLKSKSTNSSRIVPKRGSHETFRSRLQILESKQVSVHVRKLSKSSIKGVRGDGQFSLEKRL